MHDVSANQITTIIDLQVKINTLKNYFPTEVVNEKEKEKKKKKVEKKNKEKVSHCD
jgi:hypothetical protein